MLPPAMHFSFQAVFQLRLKWHLMGFVSGSPSSIPIHGLLWVEACVLICQYDIVEEGFVINIGKYLVIGALWPRICQQRIRGNQLQVESKEMSSGCETGPRQCSPLLLPSCSHIPTHCMDVLSASISSHMLPVVCMRVASRLGP